MTEEYVTPEDEYKKIKKLKKEDVQILQEWINKQPHLPKISEHKIISFLNACYFEIEPTKARIDKFYTLRAKWSEFMYNRNIFSNDLQETLRSFLGIVFPIRTKENYLIFFLKCMNADPSIFIHINYVIICDMLVTFWCKRYGISDGIVMLFDVEGYSMNHILKCRLDILRKFIYYYQKLIPIRLKSLHIINMSPAIEMFLSIAKPFMSEKLLNMLHVHQKIDTVYDFIPKEVLPNEYGGEGGTVKELHENVIISMEENANYLKDDGLEVADESKRLEKSNDLDDIFGIDGTFKKLEID